MIKKDNISSKKLTALVIGIVALVGLSFIYFNSNKAMNEYQKIRNYDKYVTLGEYKNLSYNKDDIKISKNDIDNEINTILSSRAKSTNVKKGKVKKGDTINLSYKGTINGKEFPAGSQDISSLVVGNNVMPKDFENSLIGKKNWRYV